MEIPIQQSDEMATGSRLLPFAFSLDGTSCTKVFINFFTLNGRPWPSWPMPRASFSGIADWIISSPGVLNTVDVLNTWGLILIGLGLVLGLFHRSGLLAGCPLAACYYLFNPPFIGMDTWRTRGRELSPGK